MNNPEVHHSPEPRRADDALISQLTKLIDELPSLYPGENTPEKNHNQGTAIFVSDKIACEIWIGGRYGYIEYTRPESNAEPSKNPRFKPEITSLMYIDGFLGDVTNLRVPDLSLSLDAQVVDTIIQECDESDSVVERYEQEFAQEEAIEQLAGVVQAATSIKPNDELTLEQADEFNRRNPMFYFSRGMAETDVILSEHESGFPVFYGIATRPEEQVVIDLIECIQTGELLYGKGRGTQEDYDVALKTYSPTSKTFSAIELAELPIDLIRSLNSDEFDFPPNAG